MAKRWCFCFKICFMLFHTVPVCVRILGSLCGQLQVYSLKLQKSSVNWSLWGSDIFNNCCSKVVCRTKLYVSKVTQVGPIMILLFRASEGTTHWGIYSQEVQSRFEWSQFCSSLHLSHVDSAWWKVLRRWVLIQVNHFRAFVSFKRAKSGLKAFKDVSLIML